MQTLLSTLGSFSERVSLPASNQETPIDVEVISWLCAAASDFILVGDVCLEPTCLMYVFEAFSGLCMLHLQHPRFQKQLLLAPRKFCLQIFPVDEYVLGIP